MNEWTPGRKALIALAGLVILGMVVFLSLDSDDGGEAELLVKQGVVERPSPGNTVRSGQKASIRRWVNSLGWLVV